VVYDQLSVHWRTGRFRTETACRSSSHDLALKTLEQKIKLNENKLNAIYYNKDTNKIDCLDRAWSLNRLFRKPLAYPLSYEA